MTVVMKSDIDQQPIEGKDYALTPRRALVNHPLLGRGEIDPLVFDGLVLRGDVRIFSGSLDELSNQY